MTRLEMLCIAHKQQGGTIFQFEKKYNKDFLNMTDKQFFNFIVCVVSDIEYRRGINYPATCDCQATGD